MKFIIKFMGIVCGVLFLFSVAGAEEGHWELIKSKDGIDTYRMKHPGTEVCTFKAVGFVYAKMETVGEVRQDIPAYPEWMASNSRNQPSSKTIDRNTYIFHAVIKTPFPYQDRDWWSKIRPYTILTTPRFDSLQVGKSLQLSRTKGLLQNE